MSVVELSWIGLIIGILGLIAVVIISVSRYFSVLKKYKAGYYREYTQLYLTDNTTDSIQEAVRYVKITNGRE